VAKQSTNDVEGDIIVEESHPDRVPELVRLEAPHLRIAITDMVLDGPHVEGPAKRLLFVRAQGRLRAGEEVRAALAPRRMDLLLLRLNGSDHRFIHQRDHILLFSLHLVKAQIPFMFVIADEAIQRHGAEFADPHATF